MKISFLFDNSKSMSYHLDLDSFKRKIIDEIENLDKKDIINDIYIYGDKYQYGTKFNIFYNIFVWFCNL